MDMSVHQRPRAQGEGRDRLKGATIAGLVTLTCLIAVPVELIELTLASIGLSEILPVLAPPIGWPVRIALALCGAAIAAVVAGGTGGDSGPVFIGGVGPGTRGNGIMGWAQSLGLHHLARLARGDDGMVDDYPSTAPKMRAPAFRKRESSPVVDMLSRSRKDMHPDAPPRTPLIASRDLPVVTEFTMIESGPDSAPPPPPISCASPIRDTTNEVRPRPLPRSPAPLSDSDISWVRGLLADRDTKNAAPGITRPDITHIVVSESATPSAEVSDDPSASLLSLVDRFEQGVAQRIALRDAANAMERVEESLTGHSAITGESASPAIEPRIAAPVNGFDATMGDDMLDDVQPEVDEALNAALETLRKLSIKAKGR